MEDPKIAYIPVPKVASSSIRKLFMEKQIGKELMPDNSESYLRTRKGLKRSIRHSRHPSNFSDLQQDYFLFSFVRNPLTRLFSCYQDKIIESEKTDKKCKFQAYGIGFGISFNDFVCAVSDIPDSVAEQHFRSASAFITHSGELLVNYVGKLEQFSDDWHILATRFNLPLPPTTHRVSSNRVAMKDIPISSDCMKRLIKRYAQDVDLFGYRQTLETLSTRP